MSADQRRRCNERTAIVLKLQQPLRNLHAFSFLMMKKLTAVR
jgi:hypothetical protein